MPSSSVGKVFKSLNKASIYRRRCKQLQLHKKLRLGRWNIRSMLQLGKIQLLGEQMTRLGVDTCGLSDRAEIGWTRAFHNAGWPDNSILRSTYGISWVAVSFVGKQRLSNINQSLTESLLCDSTRNIMVNGMANVDLYSAIITKVSNVSKSLSV